MSESADSVHKVLVRSSGLAEEWGCIATVVAGSVAMATELNITCVIHGISNVLVVVGKCPCTMAMGLQKSLQRAFEGKLLLLTLTLNVVRA